MQSRIKRSEAFLGIHFDFHANANCKEIGKTLTRQMLRDMLEAVKPDYVQCDCKGHPGLASYPTKVGTPVPGFVRDPLKIWREVTAEYGVSLYMHYSGVVDEAAVKQHPDWAARQPDGEPWGQATSVFGPYVDELMIPMFKELVDRYGVDGVWVDGECWGVEMDYSAHARKAWKEATGLDEMPVERGDKHFERFRRFQREGFRKYLTHYIDTMHAYAPGFEIASNWAYTAHMPESVKVDMDFISGDVTPQSALTECLMDARVLAQQGKPWDLMSWSFNGKWGEPGQSTKTAVQLQQEAAVVMSCGGGYQAYFKQKGDGSIYPWTMTVMAEVAQFCRERQPYCQHAESVPQIGLILSTEGYYKHIDKLMRPWGRVYQAMRGVLCNLLDSQNAVDVVMDHHLEKDASRYPLLILPEWEIISASLKRHLLAYVNNGGKLLLIGAYPTRMFKKELKIELKGKPVEQARYVEVNGRMGGAFTTMQEVVPQRGAKVPGWLYRGNEAKGERQPAAVFTKLGQGEIAAVTMNMGERYGSARTTVARDFLQSIVRHFMPDPMVSVSGSHLVAVSLLRQKGALMVNLINTGGPHHGGCYTFDELPPVGPIDISVRLDQSPRRVTLQPGNRRLKWSYEAGILTVKVPGVEVHDIVEIR
ncbi:MAG: hypothetical protein RRC34_08085 [Lentisphaeria bacterium]|nr:hypothetical protein [Lentisphaeria bacterium]